MPKGTPIIVSDQVRDEIIDKYSNGTSAYQLAKQYGFKCSKSIAKLLKNNAISTRSQIESMQNLAIKFSGQELAEILGMNADPLVSLNDIARKFKYDPATIKYQLVQAEVYNPAKYDEYLIAKFDIITTEEQAYWLGFLAADGCISKSQKQLALQLAEIDYDHIVKFKNFIGVDYKISKAITELNGKEFIGYRYVVSSLKFVQSLVKHKLVSKKSLTLQFPDTIPDYLVKHYIRGLIDGDGSFWIDQADRLYFALVSTFEVCKQVQHHLMRHCNVQETKLEEKTANTGDKYFNLHYCGSVQCSRIARYLYDDATVFLERKQQFLSHFLANHKYGGANKIASLV